MPAWQRQFLTSNNQRPVLPGPQSRVLWGHHPGGDSGGKLHPPTRLFQAQEGNCELLGDAGPRGQSETPSKLLCDWLAARASWGGAGDIVMGRESRLAENFNLRLDLKCSV